MPMASCGRTYRCPSARPDSPVRCSASSCAISIPADKDRPGGYSRRREDTMPARTASAFWEGDLKSGKGTMKMAAWEGPYSFASRFEQGGGTNPEELLAAAHAGCFSMAFSNGLASAGHVPTRVATTAKVHLEKTPDGF